jgi:predicted esterase
MHYKYFLLNSILLLFLAVMVTNCTKSNFKGFSTPVTYGKTIQVSCDADTSQSYQLYLPSDYSPEKTYPVILLFDSHGSGELAVEKFREAAEVFGYILAGSNNSRNGISNADRIATTLLNDVTEKYKVEKKRIYAAGFSGGGRVALSLAVNSPDIAGIITCSAGLANFNPQMASHKFDIYGIAGWDDFNYQEVAEIPQMLANSGWGNAIDLFDGGHAWPPAKNIWKALLWVELNAMKNGVASRDSKMIEVAYDSIMSMVNQSIHQKRYLMSQQQCQWAVTTFSTLKNPETFNKKLSEIEASPEFNSEANNAQKIQGQESKLRNAYIQNFGVQDTIWWKKELSVLKDEMATTNDILYKQMLARTKGFLGIVAYSYTSNAIANNDLDKAAKLIDLYKILEPENPDAYYYEAMLYDKKGKTIEAVKALQQSFKLGLTDRSKINSAFSKETLGKLNIPVNLEK